MHVGDFTQAAPECWSPSQRTFAEISAVGGVGITPLRTLPKLPGSPAQTPPKPSEPSAEDGVGDAATRRPLEHAWEVKNTFIHMRSPLKTLSVSTPPKTVPSSFAPDFKVADGSHLFRGVHPLEHTPAAKPLAAAHPLATPSTPYGSTGLAPPGTDILDMAPLPAFSSWPAVPWATSALPQQQLQHTLQPQLGFLQPWQQQHATQSPPQMAPPPPPLAHTAHAVSQQMGSTLLRLSDFLPPPTLHEQSAPNTSWQDPSAMQSFLATATAPGNVTSVSNAFSDLGGLAALAALGIPPPPPPPSAPPTINQDPAAAAPLLAASCGELSPARSVSEIEAQLHRKVEQVPVGGSNLSNQPGAEALESDQPQQGPRRQRRRGKYPPPEATPAIEAPSPASPAAEERWEENWRTSGRSKPRHRRRGGAGRS